MTDLKSEREKCLIENFYFDDQTDSQIKKDN
jgi:hypothetical protein